MLQLHCIIEPDTILGDWVTVCINLLQGKFFGIKRVPFNYDDVIIKRFSS